MDVQVKKLPQSKVEMTVVLPWEEWRKHEKHAVSHMAESVNLAGFRKGKVPQGVLETRFGREAILMETAEDAIQHALPQVVAQGKVKAIGPPAIRLETVKENAPLTFILTTDVLPEITLKEWKKGVQKINEGEKQEKIVVDEREITKELERLAALRATFITVNRLAQEKDNVEIDFTVTQNGVPIEGGSARKHPLVLGSGVFIPGFEKALVGMKAGDEKTLELEFPKEYHAKRLAGKPATFAVKMLLVQERILPEINDAFVKGLGKFETLEALKESLRSGMLEEEREKQKEKHRSLILDHLIVVADLEYPGVLVEEEKKRMLRQFQTQVAGMGFTWDGYLKQMKKTEEEVKKDWEHQAKKRIAAELILQKIAALEELELSQEVIEAEMNKVLQYYKSVEGLEKNLDLPNLYASLQGQLMNEKVLSSLEAL